MVRKLEDLFTLSLSFVQYSSPEFLLRHASPQSLAPAAASTSRAPKRVRGVALVLPVQKPSQTKPGWPFSAYAGEPPPPSVAAGALRHRPHRRVAYQPPDRSKGPDLSQAVSTSQVPVNSGIFAKEPL